MKKKIAIVIPARNEEKSLPKVLEAIHSLSLNGFERKVFVVDDGSEDGTLAVAHTNGAEVVRHPISLGVGGALKTGFFLAREWGADIIAQMDADGEHDPKDLPRFLNLVLKGDVDMVVGSRFMEDSPRLSFIRRVGIRFFTWLVNKLTGYELTDVTSGYRVFKGEFLDELMFPSEKHWAIEMTLLAGKHGLKIEEIPIKSLIRKAGKSQFHELMTFVLYPLRVIKQIIDVYL